MKDNSITFISKALLVAAAIFLTASLFVPIWSIYLSAPQYPEGLGLQIWAHKIAGDVAIINGLNHYIGMKTLHHEDFIEFTILPYLIVCFVLLFLTSAITGKRILLYLSFAAFVLFGIIAMVDFWKWEYDYGHNLDPNAAIKVPGMAYQPPLIGFKQLLNFGAYSIPNIGGWLFVAAGILLLVAIVVDRRSKRKMGFNKTIILFFSIGTLLFSCQNNQPIPIKYNQDPCDFCKMTISDSRFATELITAKGRVYKFDDVACMASYMRSNPDIKITHTFFADFNQKQTFIKTADAVFVTDENLRSPMGGHTAAFTNRESAQAYATKNGGKVMRWEELQKELAEEEQDEAHHQH